MPACISHNLLVQKVSELLKQENPSLQLDTDALYWGAQGPDILFCHRIFPWQHGESLAEYGSRIHDDPPVKTFESIRRYWKQYKEEPFVTSYITGFLCHYAFDSIAHPFVHYGSHTLHEQMPEISEGDHHINIESNLDIILLRCEKEQLVTDVKLKELVPNNQTVQNTIGDFYLFLLNDLYGFTAEPALFAQMLRDTRTCHKLMTDSTMLKKPLVQRFERKEKGRRFSFYIRGISEGDEYDYANILKSEWGWPPKSDEVRTDSFFDLYEQAAQKAIKLIDGFFTDQPIAELTGDVRFG